MGPELYSVGSDAFYFQCNINYPVCDPDNSARFKVRFWAENDTTEVTVDDIMDVNCSHPYSQLDYLKLRGHLGKYVGFHDGYHLQLHVCHIQNDRFESYSLTCIIYVVKEIIIMVAIPCCN